jgi:hypothetical protein
MYHSQTIPERYGKAALHWLVFWGYSCNLHGTDPAFPFNFSYLSALRTALWQKLTEIQFLVPGVTVSKEIL